MKKIVDYSVLVASGVIAVDGALKGFKALTGGKYKEGAMIALGVAVAAYAFSYALNNIKAPKAPEVVLVQSPSTEEGA
jgi:hypothetical protein